VGPDGAPVCVVDDAAAEAERAFEEAVEMLVVLEGWKQDLLAEGRDGARASAGCGLSDRCMRRR
jgi:hypothetical protein